MMPAMQKAQRLAWAIWVCLGLSMLVGGITSLEFKNQVVTTNPEEAHALAAQLAVNLEKEVKDLKSATDTAAARLLAKPKAGFPTFLGITERPLYLFRDTTLVFWSHFDWVPSAALLKDSGAALFSDENGLALLYIRRFRQDADARVWNAVARQSIYNKYPVTNAYLKPGWVLPQFAGVSFTKDSTAAAMASVKVHGKLLVYLSVNTNSNAVQKLGANRVLLGSFIGLLLGLFAAGFGASLLALRGRPTAGLLVWGLFLVLVKLLAMHPAVAQVLAEWPIFSPKNFTPSFWGHSLGDFLASTLLASAFVWMLFRQFFRTRWMQALRKSPFLSGIAGTGLLIGMLVATARLIRTLYLHSQTVLDVTRGFRLTPERLAALGIFLTLAFILFCCAHIIGRALARLAKERPGPVYWGVLVGATCAAVVLATLQSRAWPLAGIGVFSLLAWLRLRLPEYLFRLRYQTYFYLFSMAILVAGSATQAYVRYREKHGFLDRQRFAKRLLAQGDPLAENLLSDTRLRMRADTTLHHLLTDSANFNGAEEWLRRVYADPYFDQYALEIGVYDASGNLRAGTAEAGSRQEMARFLKRSMVPTHYDGVFFAHMPSEEIFKRYLTLLDVDTGQGAPITKHKIKPEGFVSFDLKMRRLGETSVFASLLVNGPGQAPSQAEKYSYAIYDSSGVLIQDGAFNYERGFSPGWLEQKSSIETHQKDGWVHALFRQADGQQIVVSAPDTAFRDAFSNFSFLLLILVALILVFIIGFTVRQQATKKRLTFAGKIQIYLNAAFFLPLTVFGLVSFTLVELSLKADLNGGYLLRARNAAKSLEPILEQLQAARLSQPEFLKRLEDMGRFTGLNTSLYSSQGKLIFSSHPLIYRKKILSNYVNPEALTRLADEGLHETLLDEQLGKLKYSTAYIAVQIPKSRKIAAVLAVPFFEAGSELETQLSNAISTVVSSFTAVFIVFMVLSYFASQILVVPLKMITGRLKRTTLGENEPLFWPSRDEIGLLVDGYNGMLKKLEASRAALAASEKESAWREMAQQVAHEIKNPLTPMKLTVQQLQRVLSPKVDAPDLQKLQRPLAGLLEQIENLSDIAGSFSAFARMPQPKTELFDLARVVRRTAELHRADMGAHVQVSLPEVPLEAFILGDEGIFQGIINNLIINGMQAVPSVRLANISVTLARTDKGRLRLTVEDNGEGIPADVQSKIFLPNFSTKFSGSGIGLALAKRGVEHAQGRIWFETEQGKGTTFYIEVAEQLPPSA